VAKSSIPLFVFSKKEKRMKQSFGKSLLLLFLSLFGPTMTAAVKVVYQRSDSLKVVRLVAQGRKLKTADRPVYFGRQFLGVPYVAATLEGHDPECLVVNLRQLDCTTLVENVAALTWACQERGDAWKNYIKYLERLRYKDGRLNGYASRLHYFTEWMSDNTRRKLVVPVNVGAVASDSFAPVLSYMSTHPTAYPMLKKHPEWVSVIARNEKQFSGIRVNYIPRDKLNGGRSTLGAIRNGDIVAIVTRRKGLDYSHVGLAVWGKDGKLHLLNASSLRKKVVEEPQTLYRYMLGQRNQMGIRLVRLACCVN
jgi:hypothetical protein